MVSKYQSGCQRAFSMTGQLRRSLALSMALPLVILVGCQDPDSIAKVRIESGPPLAWGMEPSTTKIKPSKTDTYVVQPGDTLWAIAAVHGVEVDKLAQWNRLKNPDHLWVGQNILLKPSESDDQLSPTRVELPSATASDLDDRGIKPPVAVSDIEDRGVAPASGAADKKVKMATPVVPPPTVLAKGGAKSLQGPRPEPVPKAAAGGAVKKDAAAVKETAKKMEPSVQSPQARVKPVVKEVDGDTVEEAKAETKAAPAASSKSSSWQLPADAPKVWLWPHVGKVIGRFGKQGARQNNGIDISAREGDPVMASADGVVAYADDSLPGYGNLILLRHGGNYTTAYAHNQKILVKRGQTVRAGDKIALAGKSGGVKQAQIHFELRHHVQALNPMSYLATSN
ncbi:MAG: peptidoglycan DD-metalloendopeptidase family protein [Magnetococcales bacterium]|nr:peptidoglycan DD-metalloendopeptidase family protein [Magnetococcales bacterium]MBF0419386.1 peptidoglycan DD-metalloendopeptidase family protein [Magnetococcales bacterium]